MRTSLIGANNIAVIDDAEYVDPKLKIQMEGILVSHINFTVIDLSEVMSYLVFENRRKGGMRVHLFEYANKKYDSDSSEAAHEKRN